MPDPPAGRRAAALLLVLSALAAAACGNDDPAPRAELDEVVPCPDLYEYLPRTRALLAADGIPNLKAAFEGELDAGSRQVAVALVTGVLRVVPPRRFPELEPLLGSPQLEAILELAGGLLKGSGQLDPEVQHAFYEGLHRWIGSCEPLGPLARTIAKLMGLPADVRAALPELIEGLRRQLDSSAVSAGAWRSLLRALAEVLAAAKDSKAGLRAFALTLLATAEPATREAAMTLIEDDELVGELSGLFECLMSLESWADYPVLTGLAHLIAAEVVGLDLVAALLTPSPATAEAEAALAGIMLGMSEDEDALDSLHLALLWLLEPGRAPRVVPDVGTLVEEGGAREILGVLVRVGARDCSVGPPE